jgi:hypothetical protein
MMLITDVVPVDPNASWEGSLKLLEEIGRLKDDFDGQGTEAPGLRTKVIARLVVRLLRRAGVVPPMFLGADNNGGVSLEWHYDARFIEIIVDRAGRVEVTDYVHKGEQSHRQYNWDVPGTERLTQLIPDGEQTPVS